MKNDFSSIERLVEFGLSMAVAQQMMATMNHCIANTVVPGAGAPIASNAKRFFAVVDSAQAGPFDEHEVENMIADGRITPQSLMWRQGLSAWTMATSIPEINRLFLLKK